MTVNYVGIKFSWISLCFFSMIIYEFQAWCLRYNICSAWFLDIRMSTCFLPKAGHSLLIVAALHCFSLTSSTTVKIIPRQKYECY